MLRWNKFSKLEKFIAIATLFVALSILAYGLAPRLTHRHETIKSDPPGTDPLPLPQTAQISPEEVEAKAETPFEKMPTEVRSVASAEKSALETAPETVQKPETAVVPIPEMQKPIVEPEAPSVVKTPDINLQRPPRNLLVRDFWVWVGTGVNFTSYSQTVPGLSTVSFGRIKSPSQAFRAGFFFDDQFGLDLGYKMTPGEAESGSDVSVQNGKYEWKTLSAELIYRPDNSGEEKKSEWLWRLGVQQHEMPFIVPLTANSIKISSNNMTALSAGVEYRKLTKKNIRVETMLRYQQLVAGSSEVGTDFSLSPQLTFDGSVGAAYELKSNIFLGVYWYGQYHSYKFDYKSSSTSFSGTQSLFYSNFDLRLGVEF